MERSDLSTLCTCTQWPSNLYNPIQTSAFSWGIQWFKTRPEVPCSSSCPCWLQAPPVDRERASFRSPGSGCLLLPTQKALNTADAFLNTHKEKALSITGILCRSNPASRSPSMNPTFLCSGYFWGCKNSCILFNKNLSPFSALNICSFWQLWPAAVIIPALKFQKKFKGKNRKCKRFHNNA